MEAKPIVDTPQIKRERGGFTRFDGIVVGVIAVVLTAIGLTILVGDRVGVTLDRVEPLGTARSTSSIIIQFSETMARDSVTTRFRTDPPLEGEFVWSGSTLLFRPATPMQPGGQYNIVLERGALAESGREVLAEYQFSFTVRRPTVAYLHPADESPQNIWLADPADPSTARQITFSPSGVYDFAVSPDGTQIAFSEGSTETGTNDLKLLDIATGGITQLTNCVDASCTTPTWRPDGRMIAYERVEYNTALGGSVGASPTRIWLVDLTTVPATTRPLFPQSQILSYNAQWSADGSRIAVYDNSTVAILIYDFTNDTIVAVPSRAGTSGALSPDGARLIYPEVSLVEGQAARSYLRVVDLASQTQDFVSTPDEPLEDRSPAWRPDGGALAVARRYLDDRFTRGAQVYVIDMSDMSARPVTTDPRYANEFFRWDPTGTALVMQRFPELDENMELNAAGRPEIWTYDFGTDALVLVATNAYLPRWVP